MDSRRAKSRSLTIYGLVHRATEIEIFIIVLAVCIALVIGALALGGIIIKFSLDHSFPHWQETARAAYLLVRR